MSYPGSKGQAGTWQLIIGQMRPHDVLIEGFAGDATISRKITRPARTMLFEKDSGQAAALAMDFLIDPSVEVHHKDFIEWLKLYTSLGQKFDLQRYVIYCDPPYVLSTRKSREYYRCELSDSDHAALLSALLQVKADVLISGYPSALYDDMLKDWRCIRYRTRTRGSTVTECLWCNFPEPTELHDWRFAGRNFRDRFRLTRLKRRTLAKLARMRPIQRGFVLDAIRQTYGV